VWWEAVETSYLLTFGRNGFVLLAGKTWDEASPHLARLWEQSGMARDTPWEAVRDTVHGAWLVSAASFDRARRRAQWLRQAEGGRLYSIVTLQRPATRTWHH
jgi:hypothetical protein